MLHRYRAAFDYRELDKESRLWVPITDPKRLEEIARQISPVYHVTPDDPPTLIIHGDQDRLVPLQQSELIVEKLKKAGVETNLMVKKGAGHGWLGLDKDANQLIDWFDKHLKKAAEASHAEPQPNLTPPASGGEGRCSGDSEPAGPRPGRRPDRRE